MVPRKEELEIRVYSVDDLSVDPGRLDEMKGTIFSHE